MSTVDLYTRGASFSTPYVAINADSVIAVTSFQRRSTAARIAKKSIDGAWASPATSVYSIGSAGTLFSNGFTTPPLCRRYLELQLGMPARNCQRSWHITPAETKPMKL